jgi:hypothetical protein
MNSRQMNTPQMAATSVAPWPSAHAQRDHPDAPAQESQRMQTGAPAKVIAVGDLARAHENRIHGDVAREQTHGKQNQRGVRREQSRL